MSLTSRLKCRDSENDMAETRHDGVEEELPASRVNFHSWFSMLINIGNTERGCRRTISIEDQVWQNELKDMIWLELQAKLAGRTLAQQDAFLCAQRGLIPQVVRRILEYRFVSKRPCCRASSCTAEVSSSKESSHEDLTEVRGTADATNADSSLEAQEGCLHIDCTACSDAIGQAMGEVSELLESMEAAVSLYPSSSAAAVGHPELASPRLIDTLRAMCLWYNTALHMRLKILSVRRMMRSVRIKNRRVTPASSRPEMRPDADIYSSTASASLRASSVRFADGGVRPGDSSGSDASTRSGHTPNTPTSSDDNENEQVPL
ncbi:unnamed protein product [Leptidea sinapis]|uniref:Mitogen-activated protein kinase kinase kinase N-terminal domain-containing protein n=1 Tax=Leptidea sinapis TaxID=189913 RepID=A0A5E4R1W0_9NEOP|nr:unnamed protein product [Leptidea sinapis]